MNLAASLAVLAASVALLFFGRGRGGESHPIFPKISLGGGPTVRHVDIIFILRRSYGGRRKSELVTLRKLSRRRAYHQDRSRRGR